MEKTKKKVCPICGKEYEGFGNNALPVYDGICCDECNERFVIPTRLYFWRLKEKINILRKNNTVVKSF